MSRDNIARLASLVFGGIILVEFIYFARLPKPAALDFRGQLVLSGVAFWVGVPTSVAIVLAGFFRRDRNARLLTIVFGIGMLFLWLIIAAGHLPVS